AAPTAASTAPLSASATHAERQSGLSRMFEVFHEDFLQVPRRPLFWILILLLGFFAYEFSNGEAQISSGTTAVGGTKAWLTSEFATTQLMILIVTIMYSIFIAVAAGMAIIRDGDQKVGEILHSTRLTPGEYVWGKYFAVLAGFLGVLAVHLGLIMAFNHLMPHGENQDVIGPFVLRNYLMPALVFSVPTLVFISGTSFALGALTRKPVLVFFVPIAIVLFGSFFLWEWSPAWLSPAMNRALQFADLSGLRWIQETWLQVDKGVDFYNQQPVGLDTLIITQRFVCLALGLAAVALVQARMPHMLRNVGKTRVRRVRGKATDTATAAAVAATAADPSAARAGLVPETATLAGLSMTSQVPGFLTAVWNVARVELKELVSHPGLYLFVPLILLQTLGGVVSTAAFDAQLLNTPGILAVREMAPLTLLICALILFYTTESLQRERSTGFAPIYFASPLRTTSMLLGKSIANVVIGLAVMLACLLGSAIVLAVQGKVAFSLEPFALVWGLLLVPTFLLWTAFVSACFAVTSNRYGTYGIGLGALCLTGWFQARGKMTWLFNWDLWGTTIWSDISVLELDRMAIVLNRVLALSLAVFFGVIAVRWFTRRERDATRVVHRLQPAGIGRELLRLAPLAIVPIAVGTALGLEVHSGRGGNATKKLEHDYWQKNVATWRDAKTPSLASVDLDLEIEPAKGWLRSKGRYGVVNRTDDTLTAIPLTGGLHWENVRWTMDGDSVIPEDRARLYVFKPKRPLAPGDRAEIGFAFDGRFPKGVSKNGGGLMEYILPSGVVLTGFSSTGMAPLIGFQPEIGIEDKKNKMDPRVYPDDYWRRRLNAQSAMFDTWCDTHIRVTSPESFQHNVTGALESEQVTGGRRTTEWKSDAPVRVFNVVLGRWAVKRGEGVAVFYDPRHTYNVDEMLEALAGARKWYGEWFAPYPWKELRLSEFPGLATYAQGPPTNITFSENIGFLTKSTPKANVAFWVTAHEAAHQWWPCMAMPGDGPGSDVLSEGMAHFSTILLTEKVRGLEQRMAFCKQIEDRYGNERQKDSERPLVKMDGSLPAEGQVVYDRGGWAFWMLYRLMGEEAGRAGLQEYMATYRDNPDHPLVEEFLAVMRRHAPDPAAFDAFTAQWFFGTVVPQYLISDARLVEDPGGGFKVSARIKNVGTGTAPVTIAATRGKRFTDDYSDARETITLGPGEEQSVVIESMLEPEQLIVDPDVTLLMLERSKADVPLRQSKKASPKAV
ncbi:MAG: hypothetical protein ACREOU_10905, partial [Candidatus Eiseniibacteriota bacterium]